MIQKPLHFVFEPFSKVETVAKIDQNGKGFAFTFLAVFGRFWPFFQLPKNGL